MKRIIFILCTLFLVPLYLLAGVTTYTFTSYKWASSVGEKICDGTTDGWVSDKDAYNQTYSNGYNDAQGLPYGWGVSVKKSTTGAGATSVIAFEDVRRIVVNFCQNKSGGKGVINIKVGDNESVGLTVNKPTDGKGDYNRDSVIVLPAKQSGKIKFWVDCTDNSINIHTITIYSANGGSSAFTMDTYQLVTDVAQIKDSDQVIFGVYKEGVNYIMGYFDEYESSNNIHAVKARYSADRSQVDADDRAVYTVRKTTLNSQTAYIFRDEIRYEEAYLVASGGQTKNRLALWTDVVDPKTYGNYGYWSIAIENGAEAVITNLGNSKAKIIQYNASNSPTLFACYADRSQTPVCLYRRVPALGDVEAIVAPLVNFGTTIEKTGKKTITVNANKLTQDIAVSLKDGSKFSSSPALLDQEGGSLTISYDIAAAGHYTDTLILKSGTTETRVAVILNRINPMNISEAVKQEDHTVIYLNEVVVTKKFDNYIYIRDNTGSMLLFDRGEDGKRFGSKVDEGHHLTGITGRYLNYFGVPEISPSEKFSTTTQEDVQPEIAPDVIDSADVCRYLVLNDAVVNSWTSLTYKGKEYAVSNKFNLSSFTESVPTNTFVIVSYDHDVVTLYIVKQEIPSGIDTIQNNTPRTKVVRDGIIYVETENGRYTLQGEQIL